MSIIVTKLGAHFRILGDEVIWVWPWQRKKNAGHAWYSMDFMYSYPTLDKLLWDHVGFAVTCAKASLADGHDNEC